MFVREAAKKLFFSWWEGPHTPSLLVAMPLKKNAASLTNIYRKTFALYLGWYLLLRYLWIRIQFKTLYTVSINDYVCLYDVRLYVRRSLNITASNSRQKYHYKNQRTKLILSFLATYLTSYVVCILRNVQPTISALYRKSYKTQKVCI